MLRKIVLTVVIGSLLAGGLFYIFKNTAAPQKEVVGEWSERVSERPEEPLSAKVPQDVLGEEVSLAASSDQEPFEPIRQFVGCQENQLNINRASADELRALAGIGSVISQRIVQERQNGPFYSLSDLMRVQGIGEKTVRDIEEQAVACAGSLRSGLSSLVSDEESVLQEEKKKEESIENEEAQENSEGDVKEEKTVKEFAGCQNGQIDLNSADKEDPIKIAQIGSARADQIIELREIEPFWSVDDLDRVDGIALGGSRLQSIVEQGLACAGNPDDRNFGPPEKESSSIRATIPLPSSYEPEPTIRLSYPAENPVGEEIEILFSALDLKRSTYDLKISIESEGTLSLIYNTKATSEEDPWFSSNFYLTEVFSGSSFDDQFRLKIKEDRSDFRGEADVIARLRESGENGYLASFEGKITIIGPDQEVPEEEEAPEEEPELEGCSEGQININAADEELLQRIIQIGPSRAEQIIQLRKNRPFYSLDDLIRVSGIAEGIISQIREEGLACADQPDRIFFIEEEPEEEPEGEEIAEKEFEGCSEGQININVAEKETLTEIYQIGASRADQIIELRQAEPFWSIDDMVRISGIGESYVQGIKEQGLACAAEPY